MKRILPLCLVVFILLGYMFPVQPVKADQGTEVTFTDAQLSQIGAWALSNNLITGITDEYDFGNLPIRAPMTPADFLIALGKSIVTKDPTPLIEFGYNVAEDVVNQLKADLNDLWEGAKDFFYELFFGSPQSTLSIDDFIDTSLQFGLDQLNDILANSSESTPSPDPNYNVYLELINGKSRNYQFYQSDFWWHDYTYNPNDLGFINFLGDPNNYSFVLHDNYPQLSWFNNYDQLNKFVSYFSVYYYSSTVQVCDIFDVNIVSNNGSYSFLIIPSNFHNLFYYYADGDTNLHYVGNFEFNPSSDNYSIGVGRWQQPNTAPFGYSGTLEDCFKMLSMYCRNVNIFVDGVLWSSAVSSQLPISSGRLTFPNGEPAVREFPTGSQIDWDTLYNKIYQAIVDGLVLDFSDIDDCIVDVNGQSAVASLRLVRTDYDKLYIEQYGNDITLPYFPKTLTTGEAQAVVGGTVGNIISPYNPSNPALNEDSVIPSDIARVLYIGVFLTLFACIINRLLE